MGDARHVILALALWAATALFAAAQTTPPAEPALLVADKIEITPDRKLVASGNVEAFQGTTRLKAETITFDRDSGTLRIEGPIVIEDGDSVTILADAAELSRDLKDGLLRGARLVLDDQLQLAAVEMNRVGGRYTQLYKTAVTSCRICDGDPRPPLWQIRARRIIHDQEAQQLYFDQAQLRIRNMPILYFPRLRLPDPSLRRATGFLIPTLRTTSQLGTGIKVPYFMRLGDHRDLTLTPYLSPATNTLEFRYRQAFVKGRIEFVGAVTRDDLRPGEDRAYLFGAGRFDLRRDYVLEFDVETVSDEAYLKEYSYSDKDRLDSELRIRRARRDEYSALSFVAFKTLRDNESNATLPTNVIDATYERRLFPRGLGGEFRLGAQAHTHLRRSSNPFDGPDADSLPDGRDILRLNVEADWLRRWQVGGLAAETRVGIAADAFQIDQDATFDNNDAGLAPRAGLTLRYPLVRTGAAATHYLEPMVQLGWTGGDGLNVPNEESVRVEFDEGNLMALSRFPQPDRRERGAVAAYGVSWARYAPDGSTARLTLGQVIREDAGTDFTDTSGLSGSTSDVLVAGQMRWSSGFALSARTILGAGYKIAKAELRSDWSTDRLDLSGSYVWLTDDPAEDRPNPVSELTFDSGVNLNRHWRAAFDFRYDLELDRAARAGLAFTYTNECVRVDLGVDRRYTSSTSVEPSTNLGFTVSLRGFSTPAGSEKHVRACE